MATTQIVSIGAGRDYPTLLDFRFWAASQNLVSQDKVIIGQLYEDQEWSNSYIAFSNPNTDATRYVVVEPAPGMSFQEVAGAPFYAYPSAGIQIRLNNNQDLGCEITGGFVFRRLRIDAATAAGKTSAPVVSLYSPGAVHWPFIETCVIRGNTDHANLVAAFRNSGATPSTPMIADTLIIGTGGSNEPLAVRYAAMVDRTTVVGSVKLRQDFGWTPRLRDCAIGGDVILQWDGAQGGTSLSSSNNNVLSGAINPAVVSGGNFTQGLGLFDGAGYRPAAGGPLIGAASASADATPDLNGQNRGTNPDVGAIQRSAAEALPSGAITGVTVSGQSVTVSGTTTGTVSSGSALLLAGPGEDGVGPVQLTLGSGTFSCVFEDVPVGSYPTVEITLVNPGGPVTLVGSGATILGLSGDAQVPDASGDQGITPALLSAPGASVTGATTAIANVSTTESGGTLYALVSTLTSVSDTAIKTGDSYLVSASGVRSIALSGLLPNTTYFVHFLHVDADGNDSSSATSGSFRTKQHARLVSGLVTGASYDFRVVAVNAQGQGSPSQVVTVVAP